MGTGIPRVLRACALVGLLMAFTSFLLGAAEWVYPLDTRTGWVGKRVGNVLVPSAATKPLTPRQLSSYVRAELLTLFQCVRESSVWFCAVGVLYLFANQQLRVAKRIAAATDE
jgi:hypothetical protein